MSDVTDETDHQLYADNVTGWQPVCPLTDITNHRGRAHVLKGTPIALMRSDDEVFAIGGLCPHRGGPLADGVVVGTTAVCPMHSWDFDLRSGISPYNPADSVPTYRVRIVDGLVEVDADSVPYGPGAGYPGEYLGPWLRRGATDRGMELIHSLSKGWGIPVGAMGSERFATDRDAGTGSGHATVRDSGHRHAGLDDLVFLPAQLDRLPLLDDEAVDAATVIGSRTEKPLRLAIPLIVSHMSYGALSIEAKTALARGAHQMGTAIGSGEGGMHPEERAAAGLYILEMASGYFGWTEENIARADAIEIKIAQGAKPGTGGLLPADKVTPDIAKVRGLEPGNQAHSPARFPDLNSPADLRRRLDWIRSTAPGIPIGIKIASGHVEADLAIAVEAGADWVTIDGMGGGTGAAQEHVRDHVGLPSFVGLRRGRQWLDDHGITDVQLISTGSYRTPADMAKGLALGADAIALATAAMMAIGCQQYRACHRGTCPVGIATQAQELRLRFNPDLSSERLVRFLTAATAMISDYCRITGRRSVRDLCPDDLAALEPETAERLGL